MCIVFIKYDNPSIAVIPLTGPLRTAYGDGKFACAIINHSVSPFIYKVNTFLFISKDASVGAFVQSHPK